MITKKDFVVGNKVKIKNTGRWCWWVDNSILTISKHEMGFPAIYDTQGEERDWEQVEYCQEDGAFELFLVPHGQFEHEE